MKQLSFRLATARGFGSTVGTISLTAIAMVISALPAYSAQLVRWQFNSQTRQLEITTTEGTEPNYFILAQPPRIVVDLPETTIGAVSAEESYDGAVRQIRVNQFQPNLTRIVIELDPDIEFAAQQVQMRALDPQSSRWVVQPLFAGESPAPMASIAPAAPVAPMAQVDPDAIPIAAAAIIQNRLSLEPETDAIASEVPPLEPGAMEIAVDSEMPPTGDEVAVQRDDSQNTPEDERTDGTVDAASSGAASAIAAELTTPPAPSEPSLSPPEARSTTVDNQVARSIDTSPSVLLPAGTVLQLRYPRSVVLGLSAGESRQEILLTTQVIQDQQGITLLPAGTQVIGRFESEDDEGRFVAQALVTPDGNHLLSGTAMLEIDQQFQITPNQTLDLQIDADLPRP
ncbi:MAG: AMIN domain-containing protein [Elainellaceae cyanobacterium]